jgi:hypothetical protein
MFLKRKKPFVAGASAPTVDHLNRNFVGQAAISLAAASPLVRGRGSKLP